MTAETSNARGEWVLVPREPTAEMVQASDEISCRAEGAEHWAAMLAAAPPPPADAEPKTLPVPTHVYLTDKAAVIVGDPQRGRDEEGPEAHNCDDMGCSTIGPHVLARVPFTDERALSQQPAPQSAPEYPITATCRVCDYDYRCVSVPAKCGACGSDLPPSTPVGVEAMVWVSPDDIAPFVGSPKMSAFWGTVTLASGPGDGRTIPLYLAAAPALAQKPAAVDEGFVSRLAEALTAQDWEVDPDGDGSGIAQLRTAVLAAQQQGGRDHE